MQANYFWTWVSKV